LVKSGPSSTQAQLRNVSALAILSAVLAGASIGIFFQDDPISTLAGVLCLLWLPYAAIPLSFRAGATDLGIVLAIIIATVVLLLSPVVAFYLLASLLGVVAIPLPLCLIGLVLVPIHGARFVASSRVLRARRKADAHA
jgi:hypothetical protein